MTTPIKDTFFNFDNAYRIYLNKCLNLAKSIVIKSVYIAEAMNKAILEKGGIVDPSNPRTWRYYKNIAGEYHYLDERMTVESVDTLDQIDFTKDNLRLHRATKKAYAYGTRLYQELLSRYPNQEILILGILYPVDIDKAIEAEDRTILTYPPSLVESNEYTLIHDLQQWIYSYLRREDPTYGFSDEYWPISNLGIFYLQLLPAIITIRKSKCKTNEAHSYHVRQYLSSHGFLDEYLDAMTLKQSLRFYMNINWIERNIGKRETQYWLIREAMTARNLPVAEYNFKHSSLEQPDRIYPVNFFQKVSLNDLERVTDLDDLTLHELLLKEDPLAKLNPDEREDKERRIERQLENSLSNSLKTKVLESKVTDYTDADYEKFSKMLLNIWADWSSVGWFRSMVYFEDAIKGQRLQLRAKEAFILYLYCYYKAYGIEFERIPDIKVETVPLRKLMTKEELLEMTEHSSYTGRSSYTLLVNEVEPEFIQRLLDTRPILHPVVSIAEFYDKVKEINLSINRQLQWAYDENNYILRGYKEGMVYRMFSDHFVQLADRDSQGNAKLYSEFLHENNLNFQGYTKRDYLKLAKAIFESATGTNLQNVNSLRAVHKAMLNLLIQLSSYSVQYIRESNEEDLFIIEFTPPTPANPDSYGITEVLTEIPPPDILDINQTGIELIDGNPIVELGEKWEIDQFGKSRIEIESDTDISLESELVSIVYIENELYAWHDSEIDKDNPDDLSDIPGINTFNKLTYEQKLKIRDFYGHDYRWLDPCKVNNRIVISRPGTGFYYFTKQKISIPHPGTGFYYFTKKDKLSLKGLDYHVNRHTTINSSGFSYKDKESSIINSKGFSYP